jgi:hypothetical protein
MSDAEHERNNEHREEPKGPSLTLMYGLLALALALAITFAALIVLPFYNRR